MVAVDQHPLSGSPAGGRLTPGGDEYGFETGLEWSSPDEIGEEEAARLTAWYEDSHGQGSIELTPFVPFLIETLPGALKRYRAYAQGIHEDGGLPQLAIALLFLHLYVVERSATGARYQVIAAKRWGATRQEVLSTIHLAFLNGGPLGGNAAAGSLDLLREWEEAAPRTVEDPWPSRWWDEPAADSPTDAEQSGAARFLGRHAPEVGRLREARLAYLERTWALPARMRDLMLFHCAVARGREEDAAAAARRARADGTDRRAVLEALGFAILYLDAIALDRICTTLEPIFGDWD
jgi:alkylhydroperoxidase/carboxymuconolactone decarboxylase family protein YurZ